ncbi:MAG TPA: helix-turn-helix domain-containing protein [Chthoniobacterales bacterium]|nr:helix-turn-helix domain-containing protein [Chthoniobacterales bacterium]
MGHTCLHKENGRNSTVPTGNNTAKTEQPAGLDISPPPVAIRRRIGFIGFDGVRTLDLAGPLDAFTASRSLSMSPGAVQAAPYQIVIIGLKQKNFVSESGITFRAQETTDTVTDLDTIIIPGGSGLQRNDTLAELARWLTTNGSKARRVAAVCGGIYPLAQSGLLDGRTVTTHWRLAHDLAKRFPAVHVKTHSTFVKDGSFYTCGGGAAGIEMALSLIQEDQGPDVAMGLAREMVVRLRPPGEDEGQPDLSVYQSSPSDKIAELPSWIVAHLDHDLSVQVLAQRACVCPRHLRRLFRIAFKKSPAEFVEQLRLREAGRRLQTSRHSIDSIASAVGYASADVFRRAFERRVGVTPREYRKRAFSARPMPVFATR